jgi:small conductance mechanosensitive channel
MALSGTLQNFAGGVMIMFMQPYRIGDYIEAQGQAGTVKEIRLFSTVITTTDNKRIYIPNTSISNAIVNNYSAEKLRRVEWNIAIAYGDDVATARSAILDLLKQDKRVLTTPKAPANPFVGVAELADSSVNLVVRAWVASADYWDVFYEKNELFYTQLPDAGIHFPYPQLDVHVEKADA